MSKVSNGRLRRLARSSADDAARLMSVLQAQTEHQARRIAELEDDNLQLRLELAAVRDALLGALLEPVDMVDWDTGEVTAGWALIRP